MTVFISFASMDREAVRRLAQELEDGEYTVWLADDLRGGEAWWPVILQQIRDCSVFLLALSDCSLRSEPCKTELAYAQSLGKPVLPVQIGTVTSVRNTKLADIHIVEYRESTRGAGIALMRAAAACSDRSAGLPDPLPPEPAVPYGYLRVIAEKVHSPEPLSPSDQAGIVEQLAEGLRRTGDAGVREDNLSLLRDMRDRADLSARSATEIATLLDAPVPGPSVTPVSSPAPARRVGDWAAGAGAATILSMFFAVPPITAGLGVFAIGFGVWSLSLGQDGARARLVTIVLVCSLALVVTMGAAGWF